MNDTDVANLIILTLLILMLDLIAFPLKYPLSDIIFQRFLLSRSTVPGLGTRASEQTLNGISQMVFSYNQCFPLCHCSHLGPSYIINTCPNTPTHLVIGLKDYRIYGQMFPFTHYQSVGRVGYIVILYPYSVLLEYIFGCCNLIAIGTTFSNVAFVCNVTSLNVFGFAWGFSQWWYGPQLIGPRKRLDCHKQNRTDHLSYDLFTYNISYQFNLWFENPRLRQVLLRLCLKFLVALCALFWMHISYLPTWHWFEGQGLSQEAGLPS